MEESGGLGFFEKFGTIIKNPRGFFISVKGEQGVGSALGFYSLVLTLTLFLAIIVATFTDSPFALIGIPFIPIVLILGIALLFLNSLFYKKALSMLKVSSSYGEIFRIFSYSSFGAILAIIPFVGSFLAFIYTAYLFFTGLTSTYNISYGKAFGSVLVYVIVLAIAALVIVAIFTIFAMIFGPTATLP